MQASKLVVLSGLAVFAGAAGIGRAQEDLYRPPASRSAARAPAAVLPGPVQPVSYELDTATGSEPVSPPTGTAGTIYPLRPVHFQAPSSAPRLTPGWGTDPDLVPPAPAVERERATDVPEYAYPATPVNEATPIPRPEEAEKEEEPKYPTIRLTGFFQADAGYFDQTERNRLVLGDIENYLGFRRARLAATGNVTENTSYIMEFDFALLQAPFVDVWLNFAEVPYAGNVRIGRYRQPFGMTELTSIRDIPFLERPLPFVLSPFRQTGIMIYDHNEEETATYAISGYRFPSDNWGNVFGDRGGYGLASRFTYLPYIDECGEELVHVGFDYSYNEAARDQLQFAYQPEFAGGQNIAFGPEALERDAELIELVPPFVNTGIFPFGHSNLFNIETAAKAGPLVFQSEMRWAAVDQLNGAENTFPSFYAHVRYVLTGETIPYLREAGVFGRVVPENPVRFGSGGGIGAWEVAARVSYIDLNGNNLPGPGRRLTDTTLGLNWYVNRFTKFQFNWIHAFLDDPTYDQTDANVYAARAQLDF